MSGDIFLKLDGVQGESIKEGHKNEIDVETFSWGESNPTSFAAGAGGVGKVQIQDVHFTKTIDKASPNLYQVCASGKHIPKAVFTFRKAGDKPQEYLKITLSDVMVSSISLQDHFQGGALAQESVSLAYEKITIGYKPQKADGSLDAEVSFAWNIKENKAEQS